MTDYENHKRRSLIHHRLCRQMRRFARAHDAEGNFAHAWQRVLEQDEIGKRMDALLLFSDKEMRDYLGIAAPAVPWAPKRQNTVPLAHRRRPAFARPRNLMAEFQAIADAENQKHVLASIDDLVDDFNTSEVLDLASRRGSIADTVACLIDKIRDQQDDRAEVVLKALVGRLTKLIPDHFDM